MASGGADPELAPGEQRFVDLLSNKKRRTPEYEFERAVRDIENPSAYTLFKPTFNISTTADENYTTYSLLMFCVQYHKQAHAFEAFKALLDRNPDLLWTNNKGSNVLLLLAKRNLIMWAQLCLERFQGDPRTETEQELIKKHKDKLCFLNNGSHSNWTALHSAIENDHNNFAIWLLQNGATPNIKDKDTAWTPLHHAVYKQNKAVTSKMLRHQHVDAGLAQPGVHREYGKTGICPKQMLEMAKENLKKNPVKKELKTLVVLTTIKSFTERVEPREGADKDYALLKEKFENSVDCTVVPATFKGEVTKSDIQEQLNYVKECMANYDLLFWAVSSHGGSDAHGEFFYTSKLEKVYIINDWIYQLSPEMCKEMRNKYSLFFPICCRNPESPDIQGSESSCPAQPARPSASFVHDLGKYGRIYATSGEESSLRYGKVGSLAAIAFAEHLHPNTIKEKSIRELIIEAAVYLRGFLLKTEDSKGYTVQRLGFEDFIMEDIYFKPKLAQ